MVDGRGQPSGLQRAASLVGRVVRAWRILPYERRLAAAGAIGLFLTLFLPWYQVTAFAQGKTLERATASLTGWGAFSFVEAAVLLVAGGVLTLLFQRAEGRAFHLPGGDGWVIAAAGFWTCVLIIWRIFDKQGSSSHGQIGAASGIEWGIFIALAVGAFLAYAGNRIRAAHSPEPPLPWEERPTQVRDSPEPDAPSRRERNDPARQPTPVAADDPRRRVAADDPRRRVAADDPPTPVAADDPPTRLLDPSTPAGRSRRAAGPADDQLTMPLEDQGFQD
jgi:hypothetical protein